MVSQFLSLHYYFNPAPTSYVNRKEWVIAFALILLVGGILLYIYRYKYIHNKKAKKILKPYPFKLITYGLIALLLFFFRVTGIPYLSMRIWWIVLFGFIIHNFIALVRAWRKKDKGVQPQEKKIDSRSKYLPKKKKKK